jgi:hypothetical protein
MNNNRELIQHLNGMFPETQVNKSLRKKKDNFHSKLEFSVDEKISQLKKSIKYSFVYHNYTVVTKKNIITQIITDGSVDEIKILTSINFELSESQNIQNHLIALQAALEFTLDFTQDRDTL